MALHGRPKGVLAAVAEAGSLSFGDLLYASLSANRPIDILLLSPATQTPCGEAWSKSVPYKDGK